ncbi:MAG: phage tail protein [Eubacteriales bacterium]|nr:phage tail protein [Eubacteriales bacterium]
MAFTTGQKVTLNNTALYVSSDATNKAATKTGTYYIWSAATKNGRIRITSKSAWCGKNPAGTYVTGWVNVSSISGNTTTVGSTNKPTVQSAKQTEPILQSIVPAKEEESNVTPVDVKPGQIGYIGMVLFIVSPDLVRTANNFVWSSSASYVSHDLHMRRSMTEFTGVDADSISLNILLTTALGASPVDDYVQLLTYQREGTAVPVKLGRAYGFYRWVIETLSFSGTHSDPQGNWTEANVQVKMKAYEK